MTYIHDIDTYNLNSFKYSVSFTLKCDSLAELDEKTTTIKKMMQQQMFEDTRVVTNPELMINNYHAYLPGNTCQIFDYIYNNALPLVHYLPLHEEFKGYDTFDDSKPTNQLYLNRNNEIVKYHTFYIYPDINFKHHLTQASTGSGKTFDFNKQIDGILSEDSNKSGTKQNVVMAIEPKKGFLKLCKYYEGELISYDLSGKKSYNPFFKKKDLYPLDNMSYEDFDKSKSNYDVMILDYYINLLEYLVKERKQSQHCTTCQNGINGDNHKNL